MAFYEVLRPLLSLPLDRLHSFFETLIQQLSRSLANTECAADGAQSTGCRDDTVAMRLKVVAFLAILVASAAGVATPLVGRNWRFLATGSGAFVLTKAFAAGIILATGFVHMLPDGEEALANHCLPSWPWSEFPFAGFMAMAAALGTLVLEFLGTLFYERNHRTQRKETMAEAAAVDEESVAGPSSAGAEEDGMHIVGTHLHRHSHRQVAHVAAAPSGRADGYDQGDDNSPRHAVVSQILELGIVSHSVIIGLSLGVSQSPCTIRPLVAALSFHQFFEGFALGGCISQAQFGGMAAATMAIFFAVTTPVGIAVGAVLSSSYNPDSPRALVVEGLLDSVSAGILIYMALVDLIAADFHTHSMRSSGARLQGFSCLALFLGAMSMSLLALWA
ncbi:hypothetical protein Taro_045662 [Colocasia esculenta]|uniref:Uncharacterized protein n=1 Tax=Colocasia esculenta TaxID=4460 RepID=A0A843X552_COLES|nr:hypothetical protein [Colocasia esculenta]